MLVIEQNDKLNDQIANVPAVYVVSKAGKIIYVGCTAMLRDRFAQHLKGGRFRGAEHTVQFFVCSDPNRRFAFERKLIAKYQPEMNRYRGRNFSRCAPRKAANCQPEDSGALRVTVAERLREQRERRQGAVTFGRSGGQSVSERKAQAARENGKAGGRHPVERPCKFCGELYAAAKMREHLPQCPKKQRKKRVSKAS